ncbi:NAD(P)-binding protein [Eremomyces bilateralis CBS 781.70]|uniref:NAD(P)-binding protein n=1 Tax=Eremomyces bilateralis CBS 781.70 TaxID=1392243 RepID=A0A6G1G6P2_9PEZI|nr:NAD(P)-binding protein [Eremomyces bilateralis CBS 781.70]KAF1813692.1 NAD(P)-binding protein [Eremomyces bilateralis CBS 781.70]
MVANKGLIFKQVPQGYPVPGQDLVVESREFNPDTPPAGGLSVKNHYLSFDPYQRGRMRAPDIKSYSAPFKLNEPITNRGISTVLKSDNPNFKAGDVIVSTDSCPTAEYGYLDKEVTERAHVLDNPYKLDPKVFIGALGMPGLTAYSSFYDIGKPKKGETIFISAASGAVGQLVGQLAKHEGLKVIGSVGDDKKLDFILKDLGFDSGFNYKKEKPAAALARLAPDGIDIYYENVGGEQLEAAIDAMKAFGRIVACGMISQYNLLPTAENPTPAYPIRNLMLIVARRITFRGFIVGDDNMGPVYAKEHRENVSKWIADGSFKAQMSTTEGIDGAAEGFVGMLQGKNFGKAVLEISPLKTS